MIKLILSIVFAIVGILLITKYDKKNKKVSFRFSEVRIFSAIVAVVVAFFFYLDRESPVRYPETPVRKTEYVDPREAARIKAREEAAARRREAEEKEKQELLQNPRIAKIYKENPYLNPKDISRVLAGDIWIGMPVRLLYIKRGAPDSENVSNYGNGNQYQYCWWDFNTSCFYDTDGDGKVDSYN